MAEGGADTLIGGEGNDRLLGGVGADTLTGGAGNDSFFFLSTTQPDNSVVYDSTSQSTDLITDFTEGDRIYIQGVNLSGSAVAGTGNTAQNQVQVAYANGITTLYVGIDSQIGSEMVIKLTGNYSPEQLLLSGTDIKLDTTSPTLSNTNPLDNATDMAVDTPIVLTFSEAVKAGTGHIVISNGTDSHSISVADTTQVTISNNIATIKPATALSSGSHYFIQIENTAFTDLVGNAYAGINDTSSLDFSTKSMLPAIAPIINSTATTTAFIEAKDVTSTAVIIDSGITLTDADSNTLATAKVSISGHYVIGQDILLFTNDAANMGNIIGSFNSNTGVLSLSSSGNSATLSEWQTALRSVQYLNSSDTPDINSRTISFVVNDGGLDSIPATKTLSVTASNDSPVFTAFNSAVTTGTEDKLITVSFADLQAQGNESDVDGTVTGFVVKSVNSGTLKIGLNTATATDWNVLSNNTIDATHLAFWTPALNANGELGAFTVVARDDGGLESATAVQAMINITAVPDVDVTEGVNPVEGGATGTFIITLDSAPTSDLIVNYTLAGSASLASDYTVTAGSNVKAVTLNTFTIAAGQTSATLNLNALTDAVNDPNETVILNLVTGSGYSVAATSNSSFVAKVDYATGSLPWSVITGDFNGDGKVDLVVGNANASMVSVLLGTGTGTFAPKIDFAAGLNPMSVSTSDFNGDGILDLAVANQSSHTVSVLLGTGAGTFSTKLDITTGVSPNSVNTGDFNGDGKVDLVVANSNSNTVSVFLGTGTGTFAAKVDTATGSLPYSVSTGDFNGDGKVDLAVANYWDNTVSVLLGTGLGTFYSKADYATGANPDSISTSDFNGDGIVDLAVANYGANTVSVLLGTSTGTFAAKVDYATGTVPFSVSTGDFNGDGKVDLVVANESSSTISVLLGTGTGTFYPKVDYPTGARPYSVSTGDFNGDGKVDLAVADFNSSTISVLLNNATPSATLAITDVNTAPTLGGTFTTAATVNDNATTTPFSLVTVNDAENNNVSISITYNAANGTLTGSGLTGSAGNYTLSSVALATVQNELQALVFTPTNNQVTPTANVQTIFTLTPYDGNLYGTANSSTKITATSINDAPTLATPTAVSFTDTIASDSFSPNTGTLVGGDVDTGQSKTYGILSVTASGGTSTQVGSYGTLVVTNSTGAYTYTPNASAINGLKTDASDSFTVTVSDGVATTNATYTVNIIGANDAPIITSSNTGSVAENAATNTVIYTATATDVDVNDTQTYSLKAATGDVALLNINAQTGAVTLKNSADFETKASYNFTVVATDASGLTAEKAVTIGVTNVNEAPVISSGATGSVAENAPITTVIYTATATDVDVNDTRTYSLKAATGDVALLNINAQTGAVTLKNSADFETKASYNFTVVATDAGGLTAEKAVTVGVTNVNEMPAGTDNTVTTLEDTAYTFTTANFGFTDPNDTPANTLLNVIIASLPTAGSLQLNGVAVTANQSVSATDITNGLLKFIPATNANSLAYANFSFRVQDNGGIANGGVDTDNTPNTLTVNVMAVPDVTITAGTTPFEGGTTGTFIITLDSAPTSDLTINYSLAGSASLATDYIVTAATNVKAITTNTFTIASGQTSATLNINALSDAVADPKETVILNLASGSAYQLASGFFAAKVDTATGVKPYSVSTGDFNGDGNIDIAVTNFYSNTVSVLLGTGTGTFAAKVDTTTGAAPESVSTGDFNGDAIVDLAVANHGDATVSVLLGTGSGTFYPKVDYATGYTSVSISTGDYNGDGNVDLAVANWSDSTVSVLLGTGSGTFNPKADYATGYIPTSVSTGDFNGDGKLDLVAANLSANTVSVLLGTGTGTFATKVDTATGALPISVSTSDFNGDGKVDLAVANYGAATVSVLLGTGSGTFYPKVDYATGYNPASVSTSDFNGDGNIDLVVANYGAATVSVLLGTGNGTFAAKLDYSTGSAPVSVSTSDFNGDGKVDLAIANRDSNTVSVLLNNANPSATLTIIDANTAPTATHLNQTIIYTEDQIASIADIAITAPDTNPLKVSITLTDRNSNIGSLTANSGNGEKYDSATGMWTITGTKAAVNAALAAVAFEPVANGYGNTSATVSISDGIAPVITGTLSFNGIAVNDAPSFLAGFGYVMTDLGGYPAGYGEYGKQVAVQTDGKILIAGCSGGDFALVRYNSDGSLDTSFNGNGIITTDIANFYEYGESVAIQTDGKILVAGGSHYGVNLGFALVRYNRDGSLDTSFDGDGKVTTLVGSNFDYAESVIVQADGKILVAGSSDDHLALARYNSDGTLDTSFDGDGIVTPNIGYSISINSHSVSIALQADGKILIAGGAGGLIVTRFNNDGSLDTGFGVSGIAKTDVGLGYSETQSVSLQKDGKIIVAGTLYYTNSTNLPDGSSIGKSGGRDFVIARYNSDGTLDTSFSGDGIVTTDFRSNSDMWPSVTVQPDGKILMTGSSYNALNVSDFAIARYNSDGSLDTSFSGDGMVLTPIDTYSGVAQSVTLQGDNKILVAGFYYNDGVNNNGFALARYNPDGSLDSSFGLPANALVNNVTYTENSPAFVLDSNVKISDIELDATNNYNGASVTLIRHGGANAEDVFTGSSSLLLNMTDKTVVLNAVTVGGFIQYNGQLVITFNDHATSAIVDSVLQHIAYTNTSDNPPTSVQIDWTFNDGNTGAQGTGGALTATRSTIVNIIAVNDAPTLTAFESSIVAGNEDSTITVNFSDLLAKSNAADVDGTVDGFVIKAVTNGSLKIGDTLATAKDWVASSNDTVNSTLNAYWTPASNASGNLNAFKVVAKDNGGLESATPVQAMINVHSVNDAPTLTAFAGSVVNGNEDSTITVSFADLQAQGDEADVDGSVTAFVVKSVSSGTLKIGLNAATATDWNVLSNSTIDATHLAFWTPGLNANGELNAFSVVAKDDGGLESATAMQATVNVAAVPDVNVTAGVNPVEGGAMGTLIITLDSAPTTDLIVNYTLAGSASLATDYTVTAGSNVKAVTANSFTIAAGQTSATLLVNALADTVLDPNETVSLDLADGMGYNISGGSLEFASKVDIATGLYPYSVSAGDFNNDGKLDLAVANYGNDTVTLLLRNADNSGFDSKNDYTTGSGPVSTTVGDFNHDGRLDLAVSNDRTNDISVFLRNATNTGFENKITYNAGSGPDSINVGDFNNDGNLDLVVSNYYWDTVSVLFGKAGNSGFETKVDYAVGVHPYSVTVGDFNNDGKLDLATANWAGNSVSVLLRNANNTGFDTKVDYAAGEAPKSITTGDFNNDGKLDLAVANFYGNSVSVFYRNVSNTGFEPKLDVATVSEPFSINTGDFNNDGKTDLAVTNTGHSNQARVSVILRNATNTGFEANADYVTGINPFSVAVGDFNNDGKTDLAVANRNDGTVSVLTNTSSATLTITDTPYNHAPTGSNNTLSLNEDNSLSLKISDFGFSDIDAGDTLQSIQITRSVNAGTLLLDGKAVVLNQAIAAADIAQLKFTPASNANGNAYASFDFKVNDGQLDSLNSNTLTFNVAAVNDAPSLASLSFVTYITTPAYVFDTVITDNLPKAPFWNGLGTTYAIVGGMDSADGTLSIMTTDSTGLTLNKSTGAYSFEPYNTNTVGGVFPIAVFYNGILTSSRYVLDFSQVGGDGSLEKEVLSIANPTESLINYTENASLVALNVNIKLYDIELNAVNNYYGSSITLARQGGADSQDVFTGSGTLTLNNNTVVVNNISVGTYSETKGQLLINFNDNATNVNVQSVARQIAYTNTSDNPPASVQIDWIFNDGNTGAQGTGGALTATGSTTVNITAVNDVPTFTAFESTIATGNEDSTITVSFSDLLAKSNAADVDGTVDGFAIKAVTNGSLKIGDTLATAKDWAAGSNDTVNSNLKAYWTPATHVSGNLNAFTVVAKDNGGLESTTLVQAMINVNPVNNAPSLTAFAAPVTSGNEDTVITVTLDDLKAQGNEADADGTVTGFVVREVSTGTLKIGASEATATDWSMTNNTIDDTHLAFWTPASDSNGTLNAFTVVARDNSGLESLTPVQATIGVKAVPDVTITTVNDTVEGGLPGTFLITLDSPAPDGGITVNFSLSGQAKPITDYTLEAGNHITAISANSFTIAAGETSATIAVQALNDPLFDPKETVTLTLNTGSGYQLLSSHELKFAPALDYATGLNPHSVAVGDFNNDGKLDIAVANIGSNSVSILLRNADNTGFDGKIDYATGKAPTAVTTGDFNNDGILDLAVANSGSATVSVLLGKANGFNAKTDYATDADSASVVTGDFNGDGRLDLAVANGETGTISLLLGNATGFDAKQDLAGADPGSYSVAIGDLNGDGKLDLAVVNQGSDTVSVLLRNADNTGFNPKMDYATSFLPEAVAIGDVNHDGKPDLVVANRADDSVSVLLANDNGFDAKIDYVTGSTPQSVSIVDINHDGRPDLIVTNANSQTVSVLLAKVDGTGFDTKVDYATGFSPQSANIGDFNHDGNTDIAVANFASNTVSVLLNNAIPSATLIIEDNAPPIVIAGTVTEFIEQTPITVTPAISIHDSNGDADWNGGLLRVQITGNASADDRLILAAVNNSGIWLDGTQLKFNTTVIGTASASSANGDNAWTFSFNDQVGNSLVQATAAAIKFNNISDAPSTLDRSITFTATDKNHATGFAIQTVKVIPVNDAPQGADKTITLLEDHSYNLTAADFGFSDPNDNPANSLKAVKFTTLSTAGTLTLSNSAVKAGDFIQLADINAGLLKFTPATNANGNSYASFSFQVQDDGGTANGGVDLASTANTLTFNVTSVNDAPQGADKTITLLEDHSYNLTAADFGFSDPNDNPANGLKAVKLTSLPNAGTLNLGDSAVKAGDFIKLADINAGLLKFTPAANANGNSYASFSFQVQDDGGTANGGVDLASTANTMTFNVTSVNDAPQGTDKTLSLLEDSSYNLTATDFGLTDPNDNPANSLWAIKLVTLPSAGSFKLNGVQLTTVQSISLTDINSGKLSFTPLANVNGNNYASFTFQVQDNGGTANGGVDLSVTTNKLTFNITPVNDMPAGTDNTVTCLEDSVYTFTTANFGFSDRNDSPANKLLNVIITALPDAGNLLLNGKAVTVNQAVSAADISSGLLIFSPDANANGLNYARFGFKVQDNGGTANSGVDTDSTANTLSIHVAAVNDAPVAVNDILSANQNTAITFTASQLLSNDSDIDSNTLHIANVVNGAGGSAQLNSDGTITFTPDNNFNGAASFRYQISDGTALSNSATVAINVAAIINGSKVTTVDNPDGTTTVNIVSDSLVTGNVPLISNTSGVTELSTQLPSGVNLIAQGLQTAQSPTAASDDLNAHISATSTTNEFKDSVQSFINTIPTGNSVIVQTVTPTINDNQTPNAPIIISGTEANNTSHVALVLDLSHLPSGTVIQLDNIEFAVAIGAVRLVGGAGANTVIGDDHVQFMVLGAGDDNLHGGAGDDTVGSLSGNDQLFGDSGNDTVFGGVGNDLLTGGAGNDRLNGGFGFDTAHQSGALSDYRVETRGNSVILTNTVTGESDSFVDVEHIIFDNGSSLYIANSKGEAVAEHLITTWLHRDVSVTEGVFIQENLAKTSSDDIVKAFLSLPEAAGLQGKTAGELLAGLDSNPLILQTHGVRELAGGDGNDQGYLPTGLGLNVDGGKGFDMLKEHGTSRDAHLEINGNKLEHTQLDDGSMVSLKNVEMITYDNGETVAIAHNSTEAILGRLFHTFLDRNATSSEWQAGQDALSQHVNANNILNWFQNQSGLTQMSNQDYVNALYQNTFDHKVTTSELNAQIARLEAGSIDRSWLAVELAQTPEAVKLIGNVIEMDAWV